MSNGCDDYVVSTVLTKDDMAGTMSIQNHVVVISNATEDEARGRAMRLAMAKVPEHSIFSIMVRTVQFLTATEEPVG